MQTIILPLLLMLAAALYASVGHGGASGYLAVMSLMGIAPEVMRPVALILNIGVSAVAFFKFYRSKSFSWQIFLPLAICAVPFAYLGGTLTLPDSIYKPIIGLTLILASLQLFCSASLTQQSIKNQEVKKYPLGIYGGLGSILGLLAGLTGIGGGIFLSPILLFMRAAPIKTISGIAAAFILVNSTSGFLGYCFKHHDVFEKLPAQIWIWLPCVIIAGWLGATLGSQKLSNRTIKGILALVLLIAGVKMLM